MSFFSTLDSTAVLTGILSSLVASILWIVILFRVRPNLKVSPEMAIDIDPFTKDIVYVFKVVNQSPFFKIYELKCSISILQIIPSHNGEDTKKTEDRVELINDNYWVLERFNPRHISQWFKKDKKLKTRTNYAAQFGTKYDLKSVINDPKNRKIIRVEVFAKHPLSGFSKVKFEEYKHGSELVGGSFCSGNCFKIK